MMSGYPANRALNPKLRRKRKKPFELFGFSLREVFLILIIAFPCMGTLFPLDSYMGQIGLGGMVVGSPFNTTLILTVILAYVFWLFAEDIPKALTVLRLNWPLFLFILWAMVTSRWAEVPGTSFNRSGRLLVYTFYATYIINYIPYRRALQLFFVALGISCAISFLMIAGFPALSSTTDERGAWRGAMQHKNGLGVTVAIAFTVSLLCAYLRIFIWQYCLAVALVSLVLLKLANSATAILALVVVLGAVFIILFIANRTRHPLTVLVFISVAIGAATWIVVSSGIIFTLLGRESTLTGRAEIWEFTWDLIDAQPFWGYGQGAWSFVWIAELALRELGWGIAHAHNSWIDFRFQLGIPGLALAILMWVISTKNMLLLISRRQAAAIVLPMAIFMFLSFRSYSETIIVDPALNDMFWFAFSFSAFSKLASEITPRRRSSLPRSRQGFTVPKAQRPQPRYARNATHSR